MVHLLFIGFGGTIGAILRYIISKKISLSLNYIFPWGTFVVNIIGAFLIGFLYSFFQDIVISKDIRSFLTIGVLGAFTTFSTYSLETINLLKEGEYVLSIFNILLNNGVCLVMTFSGIAGGKLVIKLLLGR